MNMLGQETLGIDHAVAKDTLEEFSRESRSRHSTGQRQSGHVPEIDAILRDELLNATQ